MAELCQDGGVARAFLQAVLRHVEGSHPDAIRALGDIPAAVRCVDELVLEGRVSQASLRRRQKDAGRIDLDFSDGEGWRLMIELKINSPLGDAQLERYAAQAPVAAIVRDPSRLEKPAGPNWVGAVSWRTLMADLRELPLSSADGSEWRRLLEVLGHDGDLDEKQPRRSPEVQAAAELLRELTPRLVEHLGTELRRKYKEDGGRVAERFTSTGVRSGGGPWAGFGIDVPEDGTWVWIAVRNLYARAPRIRLIYYTWPDRRSRKHVRDALQSGVGSPFVEHDEAFVREEPIEELRSSPDAVYELIARRLSEIVTSGAFTRDLEYYVAQLSD